MYICYVDESGDPGIHQFSSPHYILSGLVVSADDWQEYLRRLKKFRKFLKEEYGLNQRTEIHSSELIRVNKIEEYRRIKKTNRINILREYCSHIPLIFDSAKVINVCLNSSDYKVSGEVQEVAWSRLIQRYDTYLKKTVKDKGIIIADDTDGHRIMQLLRKMRTYNPLPSHYGGKGYYDAPTDSIIEDVLQRSSHHSYFIQTVDVISHLLYRKEYPKGSLKKFGMEYQFDKIEPILLKEASKNDPLGIVRK